MERIISNHYGYNYLIIFQMKNIRDGKIIAKRHAILALVAILLVR